MLPDRCTLDVGVKYSAAIRVAQSFRLPGLNFRRQAGPRSESLLNGKRLLMNLT